MGSGGDHAERLTACPECDLLQRVAPPEARGLVRCARCGAPLYRQGTGALDRALACAVAAAVLLLVANLTPMVALDAQGNRTSTTLFGTARALHAQRMTAVGALVLVTAVVMPALDVGCTLYLLASLRLRPRHRCFPASLRLLAAVRPWSMIDVLVLGTLAALAKLVHLAHVQLGPALGAFAAVMWLMTVVPTAFDTRELAARVTGRS